VPEIKNDIFFITKSDVSGGQVIANIDINGKSEIFKGHFPGRPVVPGACILQLIKNVLENALNRKLLLTKAIQLKFLKPLIPQNSIQVQLSISFKLVEDDCYTVKANLTGDDAIYFKFQGSFSHMPET
jgi:3-hydroxyacyl-[acyl-carrier-protein] dehydratase